MQIFKLVFLLSISLLFSCDDSTIKTRSSDRGGGAVDITDSNGSKILSYSGSYALVIGQSDYAHWGDLNSIPSELNEVESVLEDQGFVVERHKNMNSKNLKRTFEKFINNYGLDANNRLLFFYSGHGYSRLNGSKGYIVPVDAPNPNFDEKGFVRKAIAMNKIVAWAEDIESKHALFLFDSCFSGTVFKLKNMPKIPRQITQAMAKPVRQFITAGSADEEVPASSTFTPAFVDALRDAKADMYKDGYVTGEELGLYLKNIVSEYTDQTPQFGKIKNYKKWLSNQTGKNYRLPTEAEWEYAARAGTETARYWGNDPDLACSYANVHDNTSKEKNGLLWTTHHNCTDGYAKTAPVGSFKANKFGLFDMLGNLWEWTCSEFTDKYNNKEKQCVTNASRFVLRGGSWGNGPGYVRSAYRDGYGPTFRVGNFGFRLVRLITL